MLLKVMNEIYKSLLMTFTWCKIWRDEYLFSEWWFFFEGTMITCAKNMSNRHWGKKQIICHVVGLGQFHKIRTYIHSQNREALKDNQRGWRWLRGRHKYIKMYLRKRNIANAISINIAENDAIFVGKRMFFFFFGIPGVWKNSQDLQNISRYLCILYTSLFIFLKYYVELITVIFSLRKEKKNNKKVETKMN